ncbi:unnamed protein product [Blepharisma stoltei]|uniref:Uncharacterized protein n=1 Tax=Blepharisma stoltei TaxID=1481888 RepID=A0AAU9K4B1_9CILI|nr:unnamed protein product [Blepharisma stoltei]
MGCCESRSYLNSEKATTMMRFRLPRRTANTNPVLLQEFYVHAVTTEEDNNTNLDLSYIKDEPLIIELINFREEKNWSEIAKFLGKISSACDIRNSKINGWAHKPESIGCLALAYLAEAACESASAIQQILPEILKFIVEFISSNSEDLRDYSLLLLYHSLEIENDTVYTDLIKRDIFPILVPLISHSIRQIRLLSAAICARLYRSREIAQNLFIKYNGEKELIQLLKRDGDSDEILCILLEHIIDLVLVRDM